MYRPPLFKSIHLLMSTWVAFISGATTVNSAAMNTGMQIISVQYPAFDSFQLYAQKYNGSSIFYFLRNLKLFSIMAAI